MRTKLGSIIAIVVLLAITGFLAHGVMNKMKRTGLSARELALDPRQFGLTTTTPPAPSSAEEPLAVFIGDFTQGSDEGGIGAQNWTSLLATDVRKSRPLRIAVDNNGEGSGYVIRGVSPAFGDEVRRMVIPETKMVVISGSRADVVAQPNEVNARARDAYRLVGQLAPGAQIVVIGPTWGADPPSPQVLATRDAVRDAAAAFNAFFVDPLQDGWFTTGEPGLIGSDSVHPTDLGNERMAQNLAPIFTNLLSGQA